MPATALREPLARIVFVPMITYGRREIMSTLGWRPNGAFGWMFTPVSLSTCRAHRQQRAREPPTLKIRKF